MNEMTMYSCEQLVVNRDRVRSVFAWEGGLIHLCCAGIYSAKGRTVDEAALRACKDLIAEKVGVFSSFRSTVRAPIAAMLAVSGNPEQTMENGLNVYDLLKKEFWSSTYLPIAAMLIAQSVQSCQYEQIAGRTRAIYDRMKAEHPFLTSGEDCSMCAMMALSAKPDDALISDMEACYRLLKQDFYSSNAVQSLSHVLALCEGAPEEKCGRTMALFDQLKAAGRKYGTNYELPTLGVLAMSGADLDVIVEDMLDIEDWLSVQKGFGFWGSVTRQQRLMYAGILAQREYINEDAMRTAAVSSTVALIVAQNAAMCAAIAASTAAAASSSSSN